MMKGTKAVAGMNIKRLMFGICVAFVLLGAFAGVASARWYVEEGELVHAVEDETVIPFYNNIITPHRMLFGRMIDKDCLLYTSPSPRDRQKSRMPSSA